MSKKTIIILIVAAVAAFLLWKRGVLSKATGGSGSGSDNSGKDVDDPTSLDYILEHITFSSTERTKIEALRQKALTDKTYSQKIQAKANDKGRSFDQQLVLEAIWSLYNPTNNAWIDGPDGSADYGWKLQQKVLKLAGQSLW